MKASLVPAAAVIPAHLAYIKVVAVKTLVVEFLHSVLDLKTLLFSFLMTLDFCFLFRKLITLKKLECSKRAFFA